MRGLFQKCRHDLSTQLSVCAFFFVCVRSCVMRRIGGRAKRISRNWKEDRRQAEEKENKQKLEDDEDLNRGRIIAIRKCRALNSCK